MTWFGRAYNRRHTALLWEWKVASAGHLEAETSVTTTREVKPMYDSLNTCLLLVFALTA